MLYSQGSVSSRLTELREEVRDRRERKPAAGEKFFFTFIHCNNFGGESPPPPPLPENLLDGTLRRGGGVFHKFRLGGVRS